MYSLKLLSEQETAAFSQLTFPHYRSALNDGFLGRRLVAVGAVILGESVGLAFAEIQETLKSAVIRSIAVTPEQRRTGIGAALLRHVEQALCSRGCVRAEIIYMTEQPCTPALEALLRSNDWPEPTPRLMICTSDLDRISRAPWAKVTEFPASFEVFLWKELKTWERADLLACQAREAFFPGVLSPFVRENLIDPHCSLGLRHNGRVVGWCMARRDGPSTLHCDALFVRKEFETQARAIALLARAIDAAQYCGKPNFIFNVSFQRPRMIQFVRRRMTPYLTSIRITHESTKCLKVRAIVA